MTLMSYSCCFSSHRIQPPSGTSTCAMFACALCEPCPRPWPKQLQTQPLLIQQIGKSCKSKDHRRTHTDYFFPDLKIFRPSDSVYLKADDKCNLSKQNIIIITSTTICGHLIGISEQLPIVAHQGQRAMAELAQFVVLTHGTRDTNHSSIVGNDRIDGSFEFHNEAFWRHRVRFRVIWAMAHNEGAPRPCCRGFGSFYIRISSESLLNESLTWDALRLCVLKMTTCTKMIKNAGTRYAP